MAEGGSALRDENQLFATALFAGFVRAGVEHVCLCPGSRSTPLAVAAARTPGLRLHPQLDERACSFFGLGIARASRRPVALICTSGTAAANFLPAVIEAHYARAPLVVLTADRPQELREWGAGQTIDQVRLFGSHVRLFVEAPVPAAGVELGAYARTLAGRAAATALGAPPGPVHLNLPFREPLEPIGSLNAKQEWFGRHEGAYVRLSRAELTPPDELVTRLAGELAAEPRGVIVAGPTDRDPALAAASGRLAKGLGWPLLAEPISQLRCGPHVPVSPVVAHYDAFLRDDRFARGHVPGAVLHLGDTPTSKPLRRWFAADPSTRLLRADPDGAWHDPSHRGGDVLQVDAALLCEALAAALAVEPGGAASAGWIEDFRAADCACERAFKKVTAGEHRLLAPATVRSVAQALPDGAHLFVSNSMPVRDLDSFWPTSDHRVHFLCNRGANGIDGVVSTALGASLAADGPTVLLTGDLAFLHDVGGLFAARRLAASCTIVVLNDDGGGIFSLLPIAEHGESVRFDELFTLAHGLTLAPAAALYGLEHTLVSNDAALRTALSASISRPGVRVLEVPIDRAANLEHRRAIWSAVSEELAADRNET